MTTPSALPFSFLYVPDLRPSFAPCALPPSVAFLHPGLPGDLDDCPRYLPKDYPLDARAARAALDELLRIGAGMGNDLREGLRAGVFPDLTTLDLFPDGGRSEYDALLQPSLSSPAAAAPDEEARLLPARLAAQKSLLLAWDLTLRLEEVYRLQQEVAAQGQSLSRLLGEGQSQEQFLDALLGSFARHGGEGVAPPDWKLVLAAMAPFLPPVVSAGIPLFSCHAGLAAELAGRGLLTPVSRERQGHGPGLADLPGPLMSVRAPLRDILGQVPGQARRHAEKPENAPWLLTSVTLYIHSSELHV